MVKFMAGSKGEGKTKKLIEMANAELKTTDGHLVYIDDDNNNMYKLHRDIRFVATGHQKLSNYREFVGFVMGILSQNSDIKTIYIDGLTNIIEQLCPDSLDKLATRLEEISKQNDVAFLAAINWENDEIPENVRKLLV